MRKKVNFETKISIILHRMETFAKEKYQVHVFPTCMTIFQISNEDYSILKDTILTMASEVFASKKARKQVKINHLNGNLFIRFKQTI